MLKSNFITAMAKGFTVLLITSVMQILALAPLQAATPGKEISDKDITSAVEDGLMFEKGMIPYEVDVSTNQGIVTLSGSVGNILAKERLIKIAESIRGVRGTIDRITVTQVSRPDADIRQDILSALHQDPATESYQVSASVKEAMATLTGGVGSYYEKQLAARIAKGVSGIKDLRNEIAVNYAAKRTDSEIEADVKSRLQWDIWINGDLIVPSVKDGNVMLNGISGSSIGKSRAAEDAWVNGVISVDNRGIMVEPWMNKDTHRKSKFAIRSDNDIKQALLAVFRLDPRVSAFSPDVAVEEGEVDLRGVVGNLKAKIAAEQDAKNITGVSRIHNLLKVRLQAQPTDADIRNQLKAALSWDPLLFKDSTIKVAVVNGVASLWGTVNTNYQWTQAQDIASRTKGVVQVQNYLKIEPDYSTGYFDWPDIASYDYGLANYIQPPYRVPGTIEPQMYLSDEQIKKDIEKNFFWSPFVARDDITVAVNEGVATLTGTVGTWIGWREADKDAHKSGAIKVVNRIKVKRGAWF